MNKSEFHNFEINKAKGFAYVQAPEQLIGGRETLDLNRILAELDKDVSKFVIELSQAVAVNSTGLGTLISAHRTLSEKNIKLYLLNPSPKITELMAMTRLDKVFIFISDISEI